MRTTLVLVQLAALGALAAAGRVPPIPAGHRAQYSLQHPDGSFKYGWDTGLGASAQVEGDASNEVRGSYSGGPVSVHYTAGVNGYVPVIVGGVPVAPAPPPLYLPVAPAGHGVKTSWTSSWSAAGPAVQAPPPPHGGVKGGPYSGVKGVPHARPTPHSGVKGAPHIGPAGPIRPDGSYSFSYSTGDQARHESADPSNNVRGSFSFKAKDDGRTRTVNYHAGAATGFVAQGAHLPTPPPASAGQAHGVQGVKGGQWQGNTQTQWTEQDPEQEPEPEPEPGSSYQFGYNTKDSSRQEVSDASGNVQGSYSYVGPDGKQRRVDYEAGPGKGFIAKGDHLPKDGDVPPQEDGGSWQQAGGVHTSWQTDAGQQTQDDGGWQQTQQQDGGWQQTQQQDGGWQQTQQQDGGWQQTQQQGGSWPVPDDEGGSQQTLIDGEQPTQQPANTKSSRGPGGSYSFSYSTDDQSREEQGDAKGNVKGSFSFVAKDDGLRRKVDYHAGAATGFVAKGDHLPKPQPSEVAEAQTTDTPILLDDKIDLRVGDSTQQTVDDDDSQQQTQGPWEDEQQTQSPDAGSDTGSEGSGHGDASYSYSYETDSSRKQESSDAQGNVKGSFSYNDGSGQPKTVTYTARDGEGFKAQGDHLPKPGQFLAAAANAGVSGAVHGGAWGRGRGPGASRPGVGIKTLAALPPTAPRGLRPQVSPAAGADPHGPAGEVQVGDGVVRTYLPPGVPGHKVGYVYEAKS